MHIIVLVLASLRFLDPQAEEIIERVAPPACYHWWRHPDQRLGAHDSRKAKRRFVSCFEHLACWFCLCFAKVAIAGVFGFAKVAMAVAFYFRVLWASE